VFYVNGMTKHRWSLRAGILGFMLTLYAMIISDLKLGVFAAVSMPAVPIVGRLLDEGRLVPLPERLIGFAIFAVALANAGWWMLLTETVRIITLAVKGIGPSPSRPQDQPRHKNPN